MLRQIFLDLAYTVGCMIMVALGLMVLIGVYSMVMYVIDDAKGRHEHE